MPTPLPKKDSSLGKKGRFKKKSHFWLVLTYETADEGCGKGGPSGVCEIWTIFALELVSYMHACHTFLGRSAACLQGGRHSKGMPPPPP